MNFERRKFVSYPCVDIPRQKLHFKYDTLDGERRHRFLLDIVVFLEGQFVSGQIPYLRIPPLRAIRLT